MRIGALALAAAVLAGAASASRGETLYNGIELPAEWPPQHERVTAEPADTPPYLLAPPAVIPIDVGRQLFVDTFLVEKTTLRRAFHAAQPYPANPVLRPDKAWEIDSFGGGVAPRMTVMPFSDGVWFDPKDQIFKAWYQGGVRGPNTLYATSDDGVHWEKPALDVVAGTNIVHVATRDSSIVWLDQEEKDPARRFKFAYSHGVDPGRHDTQPPVSLFYSPDGIHWGHEILQTPPTGDRFTAFYNPFRKVWVASLRSDGPGPASHGKYKRPGDRVRMRSYHEAPDLASALTWKPGEPVPWVGADRLDPVRMDLAVRNELYALDAVAYESVLVGLFSVWRGQAPVMEREKPDEIAVGFSRDGFHWYRPYRQALIPVSEDPKAWNYGNVQSVGGVCLVVGDRLYFYHSGRDGAGRYNPGNNSTGLASLRRDGFISMDGGDGGGVLTTRPVLFHGRYLFVNVDSADGELKVEVLDRGGRVIAPFSEENCLPVSIDNTLQAVRWKGAGDLSAIAGTPVKFRFHLRDGKLYSFWVSPDLSGASHGYVAAGGPGFTGPIDTVGSAIYEHGFTRRVRTAP